MRVLLVADGRSPITHRWLSGLLAAAHTIRIVSTYPCEPLDEVETQIMPVAFGRLAGGSVSSRPAAGGRMAALTYPVIGRARGLFLAGRYWLGPLSVYYYARAFRRAVLSFKPDLIHALRIPFEGMLASFAPGGIPLAISIWGNDLTLHSHGSPLMRSLTVRALRCAGGLLADTRRDLRLGKEMGFDPALPTLAVPGSGGIDLAEIGQARSSSHDLLSESLPAGVPLVVNPRGIRQGSVRNDTFFQAIPRVLQRAPKTTFLCPSMAGQPEAIHWVERLNIADRVRLMPTLPQATLWELFQRSEILTTISQHDGTPNSLLEGMACGCFPIAGDIESLREWITPGANGLLVDPADHAGLSEAILQAIGDPELRCRAAAFNYRLIEERVEVGKIREQVGDFYKKVAG